MADTKLVDLTAGSALNGSELLYAVQAGNDVKITAEQVGDYARANIGIVPQAASIVRQVRNETGTTLLKGEVVYINGAAGNKATVARAIATSDATSAQTFGVVQENILNNHNGYVVVAGDIFDIDTSAFSNGAQLYLSSTTAGGYTATKQFAPNHLVYIGVVTRSHINQGQIEVKIQNGYELNEIHDVLIVSKTNNDILYYDQPTDLWKNKQLSKTDVGLGNVDNTSDLNKPISTATQTALNGKLDDSQFNGLNRISVGTTAPSSPSIGDLWVDTN